MKLTKDYNNMQNYINRLDFVDSLNPSQHQQMMIVDGVNKIKRHSTSKGSGHHGTQYVKLNGSKINMIAHKRPETISSSPKHAERPNYSTIDGAPQ